MLIRKSIRTGIKVTDTEDPDILGITLKREFSNLREDMTIWFIYAPPVNYPYAKNRRNPLLKLESKFSLQNNNKQT